MRRKLSIAIMIVMVAVMLAMTSCGLAKPRTKSTESSELKVTVREVVRDTTIIIRSEKVSTVLDTTGMAAIISQLKGGRDTVLIYSKTGAAVQKYYLDSKGNLNADCEASERLFTALLREVAELREGKSKVVVTEWPSWWSARKNNILTIILAALTTVVVIQVVKRSI